MQGKGYEWDWMTAQRNNISNDKIKEATLDELLNVKEMDSKSAQSVYDYFRRNSDV